MLVRFSLCRAVLVTLACAFPSWMSFCSAAAQSSGLVSVGGEAVTQPIVAGVKIAHVGNEVILAGDLTGHVIQMVMANADRAPESLEQLRTVFKRPVIDSEIQRNKAAHLSALLQTKLFYVDARSSIPEENMPDIEKKLNQNFEETKMGVLYKLTETRNRADLETKLHELGSSLRQLKQAYRENSLGRQWLMQQINTDEEITLDQMLDYYRMHQDEFEYPSRAQWEEIEVRFDRFPTREAAQRAIVKLGNQVWHGHVDMGDVLGQHGPNVTNRVGGSHDWTRRGSLISDVLDQAIFTLPVGSLSQIIEDKTSLRIIRVVKREDAGRVPFVEAQVKIREKIRKVGLNKQMADHIERLKRKILIWVPGDQETGLKVGKQPSNRRQR